MKWTLSLVGLALVVTLGAAAWWLTRHEVERPLERGWQVHVLTLAGGGEVGSRDGWRTESRFSDPFGVAVAPDGSLYVTDAGDIGTIRRITADGHVQTINGATFETPSGVAVDAAGAVYVTDARRDTVTRLDADGRVSVLADRADGLNGPLGIAVAPGGRLVVADTYNDRIVTIEPDGTVRPLAGSAGPGFADGPAATAAFDTPTGVAVDPSGSVYVADLGNGAVRVIAPDGQVRTLTIDVPAALRPVGITAPVEGSLFVADDRGRILELFEDGGVRVLAGGLPGYAEGEGATARFRSPTGVATLAPGRLVVTDRRNAVVRLIEATTRRTLIPPAPPLHPRFDLAAFDRKPILWPFSPLEGPFEITGTLGEARGTVGSERLHAGLDVQAPEGTLVHTIRDGVVDHPAAASDFGSLNESLRIGPINYIHMRVGRSSRELPMRDPRFASSFDAEGTLYRVRVKRGSRFAAGEAIGTVNRFYHSHLNIGWAGEEWNPLLFRLPYQVDTIAPTIRRGGIQVVDAGGQIVKTRVRNRLVVSGPIRIVVDAWDQMDGNEARRRLGVYRLGFGVLPERKGKGADGEGVAVHETIRFDRQPLEAEAPRLIYYEGSGIPVYGSRTTRFLYKVTTTYREGVATDGTFDTSVLPPGDYMIRILAADVSGNEAVANRDLPIRVLPASGGLNQR